NGERIAEPRLLRAGDVVAIGATLLIVRRGRSPAAREVLGHAPFVRRLGDELVRCTSYERELAVVVLRHAANADAKALVIDQLRSIDTVASIGPRHVAILLPELGVDEALALAGAVAAHDLAVGFAAAPHDAIDPDALLAGARGACDRADAGHVLRASDTV